MVVCNIQNRTPETYHRIITKGSTVKRVERSHQHGKRAEFLSLADKVDAKGLKETTLKYFAANFAVALTSGKNDTVLETGDKNLIQEVIAAILKVDQEL
ncbi:hypothetical protein RvY_06562 [Ramazzottius varieornatus]|uniref:Uncharacterized protein n=1 Tax=Ramazzottius varieornatus TaxID=947166 RepID=A0A1D1UZ18_RAMVA|nr:hypothetical protein RvY_06562 [Ramazzottius varieornatus]